MNKQKLLESLHYRMRLWPTPWRMTPYGQWLPPLDYVWMVTEVDPRGIVRVSNTSTGHFAIFGADRIHHFEHEPHLEWDGLKHGLLVLHTQLVLSGRNVFYLPRPAPRVRRRVTH